jgi:hypothetical protein
VAGAQAELLERSASELLAMSKQEEFDEKRLETDFGAAMCALAITRWVCGAGVHPELRCLLAWRTVGMAH